MFKKILSAVLGCILSALCFSACTPMRTENTSSADKGRFSVVCTIFAEYDWVREILGSHLKEASVTYLLSDGSDLHHYQPSAPDLDKISECDIFIYVGGESDEWVQPALDTIKNPSMQTVNLMEILGENAIELPQPKIRLSKLDKDGDGVIDENEYVEPDPIYDEHVWLSLRNAQTFCSAITDVICNVDSQNEQDYRKNLESYNSKLAALDKKFRIMFSNAKKHALIFGDRFPFRYFTYDYELDWYSAVDTCKKDFQTTETQINALAKQVAYFHSSTIFTIEGTDPSVAQAIINLTEKKNQKIAVLDSGQFVTEKQIKKGKTYMSSMLENYDILEEALN